MDISTGRRGDGDSEAGCAAAGAAATTRNIRSQQCLPMPCTDGPALKRYVGAASGHDEGGLMDPSVYSWWLWTFTVLLIGRVAGQIVVASRAPRWLPPMEQWQSGLLPYPTLVAGQGVVLTLMIWISADFSRGRGFWVLPRPGLGTAALWWSAVYFGAMVARYVIRMARRPDQRGS